MTFSSQHILVLHYVALQLTKQKEFFDCINLLLSCCASIQSKIQKSSFPTPKQSNANIIALIYILQKIFFVVSMVMHHYKIFPSERQ